MHAGIDHSPHHPRPIRPPIFLERVKADSDPDGLILADHSDA